MTAFRTITPGEAITMVERAGVTDPRKHLLDSAAAGLLRGFASVSEVVMSNGERKATRGAVIPADVWQRIQRAGLSENVWDPGSTLRMEAEPADYLPGLTITGVKFSEASVQRLIES